VTTAEAGSKPAHCRKALELARQNHQWLGEDAEAEVEGEGWAIARKLAAADPDGRLDLVWMAIYGVLAKKLRGKSKGKRVDNLGAYLWASVPGKYELVRSLGRLPESPDERDAREHRAEAERLAAEQAERQRARAPDDTPPTEEDEAELRAWASGACGPTLAKFGRAALTRLEAKRGAAP
jgi:hypothetical protein